MTDTTIYLIGTSATGTDDFAQPIKTETKTSVLATGVNVSQSEYFNAGQMGIRSEFEFDINPVEYSGEKIVELAEQIQGVPAGTRLEIYRRYEPSPDKLELYCRIASGLNPKPEETGT